MKVALVHDYLFQGGGAERVVEVLHKMFPAAPVYTTIVDRDSLWPALRDADIRTSWMQRLPGLGVNHKAFLPLYPHAIESLDLRGYDLVISSSSAFAKAAKTTPYTVHVCYCHNPMRFAWDYERYMARANHGVLARAALPPLIGWLRRWDLRTASRPDVYVANSTVVAERIRRLYRRQAEIVFPPVGVARYAPAAEVEDYYLVVSRLVSYKRVDLAVAACTQSGRPLVVIGDGPDLPALRRIAGPSVRFLGRLPDEEVARHYARCRAFLLPGEEDFGITPLEANASGRPVVAYRAGGTLDTVVDGRTGVYFEEQTADALAAGIARSEEIAWDAGEIRRHAEGFGEAAFRERFMQLLDRVLAGRGPTSADAPAPAPATRR